MSKSLKRVRAALEAAALPYILRQTAEAKTAAMAAEAVGSEVDQIAKLIVFRGEASGRALLFLTAGGNQVDPIKASAVADEPLIKADAAFIRATTGFAIGGVSPVGMISGADVPLYIDPRLHEFEENWAAAGTPHHVFAMKPSDMLVLSGGQLADFTQ